MDRAIFHFPFPTSHFPFSIFYFFLPGSWMRKMSLQRHVRGEVDWLDYLVQDLYEVGVELRLSVAWREFREKALEIWRTYPCRPYTYSTSTTYLGYCSEAAELAAAQPSPAQTFPVRPCDWSETPPSLRVSSSCGLQSACCAHTTHTHHAHSELMPQLLPAHPPSLHRATRATYEPASYSTCTSTLVHSSDSSSNPVPVFQFGQIKPQIQASHRKAPLALSGEGGPRHGRARFSRSRRSSAEPAPAPAS